MIRQASKGGTALHRLPLTLVSCDAGNIPQTTPAQLLALQTDEEPATTPPSSRETEHLLDLLDPEPFIPPPSPTDTWMSQLTSNLPSPDSTNTLKQTRQLTIPPQLPPTYHNGFSPKPHQITFDSTTMG